MRTALLYEVLFTALGVSVDASVGALRSDFAENQHGMVRRCGCFQVPVLKGFL